MNIPNPHPSNEQDHSCGPDCPTCQVKQLQPDQFEVVMLHYGFPAIALDGKMPTKEIAQEYAAMLIGHKVSDYDPETLEVNAGRVLRAYLKESNPLQGGVIAVCEPLNKKPPIEFDLFEFGYSGSVTLSRRTAEKAAQTKIQTLRIVENQLVTITAIRLENDVPDGTKGRVIAICEPVQQLQEIKPRRLPYEPPRMETK